MRVAIQEPLFDFTGLANLWSGYVIEAGTRMVREKYSHPGVERHIHAEIEKRWHGC